MVATGDAEEYGICYEEKFRGAFDTRMYVKIEIKCLHLWPILPCHLVEVLQSMNMNICMQIFSYSAFGC